MHTRPLPLAVPLLFSFALAAGCYEAGSSTGRLGPGADASNGDAASCLPYEELCDGLDNDCDGEVDEDFAGLGEACTVGAGACQARGTRVCAAGGDTVACDATPGSPTEPEEQTCNGIDDDCDGEVDEGFEGLGEPCTVGVGACQATGALSCDDSGDGPRCDATPAAPIAADEVACDGVDDDCDGEIDEGCDDDGDGYCDDALTLVGAPEACPNGGGDCDDLAPQGASTHPGATEVCDELDNDCDGEVDDGATDAATYYVDCDADGYAASDVGARDDCGMPPASIAEAACGGSAGATWTTAAPTDASRTDCFDDDERVHPGQSAFFATPSGDANAPWDFDCDGGVERRWVISDVDHTLEDCPDGTRALSLCTQSGQCTYGQCPREGWTSPAAPPCGQSASFSYCDFAGADCMGVRITETRPQECR